jgi:putative transferase (TIGR04331 family)
MLETFAQDVPSLAYIPLGLSHLNQSALDQYLELKEAGLIYLTADSAAAAVSNIVNDIDSWWLDAKVSRARLNFAVTYSKISRRPASELSKILKSKSSTKH